MNLIPRLCEVDGVDGVIMNVCVELLMSNMMRHKVMLNGQDVIVGIGVFLFISLTRPN
jgi:hypothetical protein